MSNIYVTRRKAKEYWQKLSAEDRFIVTKGFVQVFGGEPDNELEEIVFERLLKGEISPSFIDTVLEYSKSGDGEFKMIAEFEETK